MQLFSYVSRILWVAPLAVAVLVMSRPAPEFLWVAAETGGPLVAIRTIASTVVAIYAAFLFYALGRLVAGLIDRRQLGEQPFFVIYLLGLLPVYLFGLILGLLRLNNAHFNAIVFISAHLILWPYIRPAFKEIVRWLKFDSRRPNSERGKRLAVAIRLCILFTLAITLLFVIAPLDVFTNDVIQYYYAYFRDIRHLGGVGFDAIEPRVSDFLIMRGLGLHHFLTSFTDEYFIRFVSFLLFLPSLSIFCFVLRPYVNASLTASDTLVTAATEFGGLALVIVVACVAEPGKYHLFNGVLYLATISLGASFVVRFSDVTTIGKIVFFALVATMPIVLLYSLVHLSILMAALITIAITRRGGLLTTLVIASTVIIVSTTISLLINYLTVGIFDLFPTWLMTHFSRPDILAQWTDPANYIYLNAMQGIHPFHSEFLVSKGTILLAYVAVYFCLSILFVKMAPGQNQHDAREMSAKLNPASLRFLLDGVFVVGFIYFSFDFLLATSAHPSLHRMLYYFPVFQFLFVVLSVATLFAAIRVFRLASERTLSYVSALLCAGMIASGVAVIAKTVREEPYHLDVSAMLHTGRWLVGQEGSLAGPHAQKFDFNLCRQIDLALPPGGRILPLNGLVRLTPCMFSPAIKRGRFIHIYESVVSPFFSIALFGRAEEQEAIYRRVGIDYFLFVLNDSEFYGPAYGNLFSAKSLSDRFEVYSVSDRYVILTWRKAAAPHLDPGLVASIDLARRLEMTTRQSFRYSDAVFETWEAVRANCGPTCSLPLTVTFNKKIRDDEGAPIGNLTGYRGLAASFDGNTSKEAASCSAPPGGVQAAAPRGFNNFIGKDWGDGVAKKIAGFKLFPPANGAILQSAAISLKLQGSNDNVAWTDLFSGTDMAPGAPEHLTVTIGIDDSAAYRFHRVNIQGNGVNALVVCQVQFFIRDDNAAVP